ncbi:MAG: 4-carboxymuconolactone decarboxylase [Chloroflexi bacterium]|nr:MAG: 4-carboxymuconolactone decarboxylase [Chloroflexota bacterium]TMG35155.1 MAG: 4-carboxymuconolactone decarboxylase [Chloroflexota bacterium]
MAGRLYEEGLRVRREVLGAEYVDKAVASATDFNREFQELVTEYCWGKVWTRPGLDRKTRSLINIAMLTALNRPHEVALHVRGALNNGCTRDDIKEVLLQTAIYCGVPAAVDSFRIAREVLEG